MSDKPHSYYVGALNAFTTNKDEADKMGKLYPVEYLYHSSVVDALIKKIAELETPLTQHQILSTCLSYRHDFGLMDIGQQAALFNEAKSWEACFKKERDFAASNKGE